ncbi:hypothetical protein IC006_0607 [Sulfuracidifex tepidarius]|uniref:Uncharacterized protein n=1 Tax=Sulfuracidifex tepidarius TaxID=1294262 RepID=A0A510DT03_9CREN|nr:hypothetical protein IC006_0607 [Sulfuracidifex tepidarius]
MLFLPSKLWIVGGALAGLGYVVAIFYFLLSKREPYRWLGLTFFLGPVGSVVNYLMTRKDERDIAVTSLFLLYGFLIWIVVALMIEVNPFYQVWGYVHGWIGI